MIRRLAEKNCASDRKSHCIEAVLLHGGDHRRKLVEARHDEQTKLQSEHRTNRLKVIP